MRQWVSFVILTLAAASASCRKDEVVLSATTDQVAQGVATSKYMGFFLLNEGNMGSNKATLDYFDYASGLYSRNIFAERNPSVARELGDVGNDLQIYGGRLYAVINCSNLVEVMDLSSAQHIGVVSIANCRYITFSDGYGYVSSYVSESSDDYRLGEVVKFDLETLEVVDRCVVGYQPEQMVVVESLNRLYVANSGGYQYDGEYDNRISVIDLASFDVVDEIEVADNLHGLELAPNGKIYISARGDNGSIGSSTHILDPATGALTNLWSLPNSRMWLSGEALYILSADYGSTSVGYGLYDTLTDAMLSTSIIADGSSSSFIHPYAIAANDETGEFFVTDASDYVTSGYIYCYSREGYLKWRAITGDIPSRIAFTTVRLGDSSDDGDDVSPSVPDETPIIEGAISATEVVEFNPAMGQYATIERGDCSAAMARLEAHQYVSLGGWGGYISVAFGCPVLNGEGYDIAVEGNFFATSNEPGIVWVSVDTNGNGECDDVWYELAGSESFSELTQRGHTKTYSDGATFTGTLLPSNISQDGDMVVMNPFEWGYADNSSSIESYQGYNRFDISNAIDAEGNYVELESVDFVRVQTAVDADAGVLGEVSTEVLHIIGRVE